MTDAEMLIVAQLCIAINDFQNAGKPVRFKLGPHGLHKELEREAAHRAARLLDAEARLQDAIGAATDLINPTAVVDMPYKPATKGVVVHDPDVFQPPKPRPTSKFD